MPYDDSGWNQATQTAMAGAGIISTQANNKKARRFALDMYNRSRQDAIDDWNRNNLYNSPSEQMARLKSAGLNPNMIYGKGPGDLTSQPIRSTESAKWKPEDIDVRPMQNALMSGYDMRMKDAQADLVNKQMQVADADIKLKGAQAYSTLTSVDRTKVGIDQDKFNLAKSEALMPFDLQYSEARARHEVANTEYTINQDERAELKNVQDLAEGAQRILTLRLGREQTNQLIAESKSRTNNLDTEGKIKQEELEIWQSGGRPGDKLWERKVMELVDWLMKKYGAPTKPRTVSPQERSDLTNPKKF